MSDLQQPPGIVLSAIALGAMVGVGGETAAVGCRSAGGRVRRISWLRTEPNFHGNSFLYGLLLL
jgi:hypothetical protein